MNDLDEIGKILQQQECRVNYKAAEIPDEEEDIINDICCDKLDKSLVLINKKQTDIIDRLDKLVAASLSELIVKKFDTGLQTLATAVTNVPEFDDVSAAGYTRINVNNQLDRNAPELYVSNIGPGNLYVRTSNNGQSFSQNESVVFEGGLKVFNDVYELRIRTSVANLQYVVTEFEHTLGMTYSTLNRVMSFDELAINNGVVIPANGSAVEFNVTNFSNVAKIMQIIITQLTAGVADYTFEIWETDGDGYNPAVRADLYLRVYSRDFIEDEDSDLINPGIIYIDRDSSTELHCRLVNNAGGTASDFDVSVKAYGNPT